MKNLIDVPLDLKEVVLSYVDASSFVSLSCTNKEWNQLLHSLWYWSDKVFQHVNIRAHEMWKYMLPLTNKIHLRVDKPIVSRDYLNSNEAHKQYKSNRSWNKFQEHRQKLFTRNLLLYKNGQKWLKLQEQRQHESKNMALLQKLISHEQQMETVSSFQASQERFTELDVAITNISIGWPWHRVEKGVVIAEFRIGTRLTFNYS